MRGVRRAALVALFLFCDVANARDAVTAKQFIVSAAHPLAAEAGYAVLQLGGSALDAAVAVQMVLGLVEPESSGIGGGAFLLHWSEQEKRLRTYDGRETAPAAARPDRFLDAGKKPMEFYAAAVGGRSVGVPGVLRLLELAHRQHGRLPWSELLQYAIFAAEEGFVLSPRLHAVLERAGFERAAPDSAAAVHLFAEAGRLAYADRARYLGDPDFVPVPVRKLLDGKYLDRRARLIGERAMREAAPGDTEANGTTHFSIADAQGNVVAMSSTIESPFGSRIMVRGFLLNNQLTGFDFTPGSANEVRPRKRPRSSMAPAMVFERGGRLRMALGSPGGPWIINYVAKTLVAGLDWSRDIQAAIEVPNFGSRNGPTLLEQGSSYESLAGPLRDRGHEVETAPLVSGLPGIERLPGGMRGGADPRREGTVRGR